MPRAKAKKPKTAKQFTKAVQTQFLEHLRNGMRRGAAAEHLGFERKTVMDFIADHEDFEALVLDAEGKATEHVEEALFHAAVSGNVTAAKTWLELRKAPASTALVPAHVPEDFESGDGELEELNDLTRG